MDHAPTGRDGLQAVFIYAAEVCQGVGVFCLIWLGLFYELEDVVPRVGYPDGFLAVNRFGVLCEGMLHEAGKCFHETVDFFYLLIHLCFLFHSQIANAFHDHPTCKDNAIRCRTKQPNRLFRCIAGHFVGG